jgi:hypothetical protein
MRKVLIIALGLASLGALAGAQPAAAKHVKCETHIFGQSRSGPDIQNHGWTPFPGELQQCFWVAQDPPPKPTSPQWGSASGFGKAIQDQKSVRAR